MRDGPDPPEPPDEAETPPPHGPLPGRAHGPLRGRAAEPDEPLPLSAVRRIGRPEERAGPWQSRPPLTAGGQRPSAPPLRDAEALYWRTAFRWGVVGGLAFLMIMTVGLWSAVQLTGRETATRLLQRGLVELTEIDAQLAQAYDALQTEARSGTTTAVALPDYPLPVTLAAPDVAEASRAEVRSLWLAASAELLYEEGLSAFERDATALGEDGLLSPRGIMRWTLGRLTGDTHQVLEVLLALSMVGTAALAAVLVLLSRGFGRMQNVGLALALGAVPMALAAVGVRAGLRTAADGAEDPFTGAWLEISAEVLQIPVRNYIVFGILGMLVAAMGLALALREERRTRPPGRRTAQPRLGGF